MIDKVTAAVLQEAPTSRLFILTGAPGSGKTSILTKLHGEFRCEDEPAREVLAGQRANGGRGTWDQDPSLFVHLLLERSIQKYESARRTKQTVLFDRAIPDSVVYALQLGVDVAPSLTAIESFRYEPDVLFLAPWPDIYVTDAERIMSVDETVAFSETLREVYQRSGYSLIDLLHGPISDRAAFVRAFITRRTETA